MSPTPKELVKRLHSELVKRLRSQADELVRIYGDPEPPKEDLSIADLCWWTMRDAADRIEALEAAASVPPPATEMEVLAEDLRRVYAPVPDHVLHRGEWWKVDQVVQSRTVFHGYACDKYEVTFPQGDVALNADRRRRVVVLVPLYDEPAVPSSEEPTE